MSDSNTTQRRQRINDKTGATFGMLTVLGRAGKKGGKYLWLCRCECGKELEAEGDSIRNGGRYACPDCTKPIRYAKVAKAQTRHGRVGTSMFTTWSAMRQRCYNPNNSRYADWGWRGIIVCDRWNNSFEAFLEDMGERPHGCELDRIDNDGPYSPENCQWSTRKKQGRNKRNNKLITFQGETLPLSDWCERLGLKYGVTNQRLTRDKWTVERAFSTRKA